jgi:hypothetical protein
VNHSPADVTAQLLIELGLATDPTAGLAWPVFVNGEPDAPDDCLTVYDQGGQDDGGLMAGELQAHYGVQVRCRTRSQAMGWVKLWAIRDALGDLAPNQTVAMTEGTPASYLVRCYAGIGQALSLGRDGNSSRRLLTLSALASLDQLPLSE